MKKKSGRKAKSFEGEMSKGRCKSVGCGNGGCMGCAYFLAFIGTAVYYIQTSTGFWNGVWGVVKALVWPAILAYKLFGFLG